MFRTLFQYIFESNSDDQTPNREVKRLGGGIEIHNPTIDHIERGMMMRGRGEAENALLVLNVNPELNRVQALFSIGGTDEHKDWIDVKNIRMVWDIGGYEKAMHLIDQFGSEVNDLDQRRSETES